MNNINNPYGRASASPRQSASPSISSAAVRTGGVNVRSPRGQNSADTLRINTTTNDSKDEIIEGLKADLEKLRKVCTCVICQELLFEPYFFQCGHVYCYGVSWNSLDIHSTQLTKIVHCIMGRPS
jgi:hypothetical protein